MKFSLLQAYLLVAAATASAQTFTVLENFTGGSDGGYPIAGLVLDGRTLYGTTEAGFGAEGSCGTLFKLNVDGSGFAVLVTNLVPGCTSGVGQSPMLLDGNTLYGARNTGIFRVNVDGSGYTVLSTFTNYDIAYANGTLVLSGSTLYGTTYAGPPNPGYGTVFKVNTDGSGFTVLKTFSGTGTGGTNSDGANPAGGLVLGGSTLYGTTLYGGTNGGGTVFRINTDGSGYKVLQSGLGGPRANLTLNGSTLYGGTYVTVFKINVDGSGYTVLKVFNPNNGDGIGLYGGVILSGSTLYGTTRYSGPNTGDGTVFRVKTNGSDFKVLKYFNYFSDGGRVYAGLVLGGTTLYGTAQRGGTMDWGTVFALDLRPPLNSQRAGNQLVLSWSDATFALQSAPNVTGTYTNIPGATSPYTNSTVGGQQFFRLIGN